MTIIESKAVINLPVEKVYQFLADCNNHEQLMPDNVYNWSSTTDEASFTIKNMAKLTLKVDQRTENSSIIFIPAEKAPFDVSLEWEVNTKGENQTEATYRIKADLNMMMKMLASGPLQKLVDHETGELKKVLEKN
ncbi:SRPBCC family protein [Olivibacter sitiensis]|uniref:SRPBCC family protein n=1 Tax=Olivibacter sitiensis TaxID=376470 RepID=UPI0004014476|nr:SRPBCC family protein [Olivibacter sitiensis]